MGTDMWIYAEYKKNGKWNLIGEIESNTDYPREGKNAQQYKPKEIYDGRDYNLFAILADVRNPTGTSLNNQKYDVISLPRGLPQDLSLEMTQWLKHWEDGVAWPSWLLLQEILDFDWENKIMVHQAMVEPSVAYLFGNGRNKFPYQQWPEDIPIRYAVKMKGGVTVTWIDAYKDSVDPYFFEVLDSIKIYANPSDIRLVFWFN
jgi:hypothetical protein